MVERNDVGTISVASYKLTGSSAPRQQAPQPTPGKIYQPEKTQSPPFEIFVVIEGCTHQRRNERDVFCDFPLDERGQQLGVRIPRRKKKKRRLCCEKG